ncbi:MAG: hypothetical protein PHV82_16365, partial [Victivallaceae bacterium]|nr:hypothetical protein [Victivallaceae bacterium]
EGGHIKFWSFNTIGRLLDNNGFEVIYKWGCGRVPYIWKSMIVVAEKIDPLAKSAAGEIAAALSKDPGETRH